jgi:hypothetical protein
MCSQQSGEEQLRSGGKWYSTQRVEVPANSHSEELSESQEA